MRALLIISLLVSAVLIAVLTRAVIRLENVNYANFVGRCVEFNIKDAQQRTARQECLENSETRTHWLWHVVYGVGVL